MRREIIPDRGKGRKKKDIGMCGDMWWEAGLYDNTLNLVKSSNAFGTIIPTTFREEEIEGGIGREGKPQHTQPLL